MIHRYGGRITLIHSKLQSVIISRNFQTQIIRIYRIYPRQQLQNRQSRLRNRLSFIIITETVSPNMGRQILETQPIHRIADISSPQPPPNSNLLLELAINDLNQHQSEVSQGPILQLQPLATSNHVSDLSLVLA